MISYPSPERIQNEVPGMAACHALLTAYEIKKTLVF